MTNVQTTLYKESDVKPLDVCIIKNKEICYNIAILLGFNDGEIIEDLIQKEKNPEYI